MPLPAKAALFFLLCLLLTAPAAFGDDWQPILPEELKMTAEPLASGAPAIYLYRQVDRDDVEFKQYNYLRIKILTEEGRKYGDVEIPFVKGAEDIHNLQARTIRPDGSTSNFDGKAYEKTILKGRGVKVLAKTFTLPEMQVGSIIEYRYTRESSPDMISQWILSDELFTKHAKFTLRLNRNLGLQWSCPLGLPQGTQPPREDHGLISLEANNIPAFHQEEYMPPENQMKYRVEFVYSRHPESDSDKFWKDFAQAEYSYVAEFIKPRKGIEAAAAQIVSPSDPPEVKLQKIYARTQQIRNFTTEPARTFQEEKREKFKDINNAEDILKYGYGSGYGITWVFLALVRAAGFDADPVLVSTRNSYFFDRKLMNAYQLNENVVLVRLNGKDVYLDPGAPYTPFGLLPWRETAVQGLRLDKEGGTWVQTPLPAAAQSRVERKAELKLTDSGDLEGRVTVTYSGLEALWRRLDELDDDDAARKKSLEDEMKGAVPMAAEVTLTRQPEWKSSSPEMVAEFELRVPGWASAAGRRQLVPVGLFSATEKHAFEHAQRVYPIYFHFPYQAKDDITVEVPSGWEINTLPTEQNNSGRVLTYAMKAEKSNGSLHWTRELTVEALMLNVKYYGALQNFFQTVRTGDEQQIILLPH